MLSVVIPAYNEEERLPRYLKEWMEFLDNKGSAYEIIVVNDGSTDHLINVLAEWDEYGKKFRVISQENKGKGSAVRTGMLAAKGDIRLFCDADGSTPVIELAKLLLKYDPKTSPIIIGSRRVIDGENIVHRDPLRHLAGRVFAFILRLITNLRFFDTQCGFKLFSGAAADKIFSISIINGWVFDVEILSLARKCGFAVTEVPISWTHKEGSKVRLASDGVVMLVDAIKIRYRMSRMNI